MTAIKALILGIIQGLAEFLPISSSGHLTIAGHLMGMDPEADSLFAFNILLHVATLAAVLIAFWRDFWEMIKEFFLMLGDLFTGKGLCLDKSEYRRMIILLIIGTIPAVIAGLLFGDLVENAPLWMVGTGLLITAALLAVTPKLDGGKKDMKTTTYPNALAVGCFQAVALLPGISRSGSTIVGGLISGLKREFAVKFSFMLSAIAIVGAAVLELKDIAAIGSQSAGAAYIAIGMVAAFLSGLLAIKGLLKLVERGKLAYFSIYCAIVGIFTIILNFVK